MLPAQSSALADHQHPRAPLASVGVGALDSTVYGGTPTAIDPDDAGAAGSASTLSRSDHEHQATCGTPNGLTKTATSAENNGLTLARNNHTHATDVLPWGVLSSGVFSSNAADSARGAGVDTDMAVTVAITANRLYKITLNSQVALSAASVAVAIELEHDGTVVGRFVRIGSGTNSAGNGPYQVSATVDYVPSATDASATFTVSNSAGSGASITMQPGINLRTLTVVDAGPT